MGSRLRVFLSRDKLEDILRAVGVKIVSETERDLLCYCPFHHNTDSPAMNMSKTAPYMWKCWNGNCAKKGNIVSLLTQKGYSFNEAKKMLVAGEVEIDEFLSYIEELLKDEEEPKNVFEGVDPERFREADAKSGFRARDYLLRRGISEDAYNHFRIGYAAKNDMLVIPAFDDRGILVGVIGRCIEYKRYKYSAGLSRGRIIWNLNRVEGSEVVLTEGALDAIYVWQAGFHDVGAVLGSAISGMQWKLLRKHVTDVVAFADNDEPGEALRDSIIQNHHGLLASAVQYPDREVKDPGDLTAEEIMHMLDTRRSSVSYLLDAV